MSVPMVLPPLAVTPLRSISEAGLTAAASRGVEQSVRQPGGVYVKVWTWSTPVPARYNPFGLDTVQRADLPSSARKGPLSVPTTTQIKAGERWRISGTTNGEAWSREVLVDEVLFPRSTEITRRAIVTETASNP